MAADSEILSDVQTSGPDALRELARQRRQSARFSADQAFRLAKRHEKWEYGFAVLAAATAAVAAALARHSDADEMSFWGIFALLASVSASLGTFLNIRKTKNHHWSRRAVLGSLAQSYEVLALRPNRRPRRK